MSVKALSHSEADIVCLFAVQDLRDGSYPGYHLLYRVRVLRFPPCYVPKSSKDFGVLQLDRFCHLYRLALYATEVVTQGRVWVCGYVAHGQGCE